MNTEDRHETLLSQYATPEDIAEVQVAREVFEQAQEKAASVLAVLRKVDAQLSALGFSRVSLARAAAVALGEEEEADAAPSPVNRAQLEAQMKGLGIRLKEEEEMAAHYKGQFHAAFVKLVETCAQRCGVDLQKATAEQAWCIQQLNVAHELVGLACPIVVSLAWGRYYVPSSENLTALKDHAREENGAQVLMSADRLNYGRAEEIARLTQHVTTLFGSNPCSRQR